VGHWRQLTRGLRGLFNRPAALQDVSDEVAHYLEQATAAHRAQGLSEAEAVRAARLELGNVTSVMQDVRSYGWENAVDNLRADLRFAARRLRNEPGFTMVAALTLAVGIGATTAILSAVNPILFQPLPYKDAGRIVAIADVGPDGRRAALTFGTYAEVGARTRSFEALAVFKPWQPTLQGTADPERLDGQRIGAEFFRALGAAPALGRDFQAADDQPGAVDVVLLSDGLWRRRFGADPAIIGRPVTLDDDPFIVIGVMPAGFDNVLAPGAAVWTPLKYAMGQGPAWGHHLRGIARLRPGVDLAAARAELDAMARNPVPEFARPVWAALPNGLIVSGLKDDVIRGVRPALVIVLGAVVLLLAIVCVNVTNLVLARGVRRRAELALRGALGAGRGRLVRQLLTESLLLAVLGGVLGMAVAALGVRALVALAPAGLPRVGAIHVDASVFGFGFAITTLIGLAFGLAPALQGARSDSDEVLHLGSRWATGGQRRARSALVVAEVALALVLLVSSGLLLRSLGRLFAVDTGFDGANVVTMQIQTSGHHLDGPDALHRFFAQALDAVRQVPGVTGAGLTSQLPLSGDADQYGVRFDPSPPDDPGEVNGTFRYAVTPGYLETMRIPLRSGRLLGEQDRGGAPRVALISESLARRRLRGRAPIGQQIQIGAEDGPLFTVVGVVGDVKQQSLAVADPDAVYIPDTQWHFADKTMSIVVRTAGSAVAIVPLVRRAIWSVDKDQAIVRVATMDALLTATAAERRFVLILFEAFALAALVLAAAGIYGVLAGSVAERTREIGVRAALGATRQEILGMVVGQGMTLTAMGVAIGIAGAIGATQALAAMLFDVSRLDPVTYVAVTALLGLVAVAASGVPAWRAAQVDPVTTLRSE